MAYLSLIIFSYLLGSISFGIILAKVRGIDIRQIGSGNIGATNVMRGLGKSSGLLVLLLDLLKGLIPILIARWFFVDWVVAACGIAVITGHLFPVFAGFRGGKGAATSLGVLLGIAPEMFVLALLLALFLIAVTRYVSVASISIPFVIFLFMVAVGKPLPYLLLVVGAWGLIVLRHRDNIKRLLGGTENRIKF